MTTWTTEKTAEELERAKKRPVIQSQPTNRESEREDGEIASVWVPVRVQGAPVVSKEEHVPLLKVKLREWPSWKMRMRLDMMVILKERSQPKWVFERELKAAEAAPTREKL